MKPSEMSAHASVHKWVNGRFTLRSGFYAGRGVKSGDLNSGILEMFYQGIKSDLGDELAGNFVRFVNQLTDLSASAFIVAFERFWSQDCMVPRVAQRSGDRNQLSGRGAGLRGEAFGLLITALGGGEKQSEEEIARASFGIKQEFIRLHRKEIPKDEVVEQQCYQRNDGFYA